MSLRKRGASPIDLSDGRPKRLRGGDTPSGSTSLATDTLSASTGTGLTTRSGRAGQQAPVDPTEVVAKTPHELDQVRQKGLILWDRVTQSKDAEGRYFANPFYKLPSKREYPDYYEIIKTPLSLDEIKKRLDRLEYTTIRAIRDDLNHVFVNAQRYNASGSPIFMDARQLKRVLKDAFDAMSGNKSLDDDDHQPGTGSSTKPSLLPDPVYAKRGPTLKPWLTKKLAELRLLKDQAGRVLTDIFEELPDRDQYPEYYQFKDDVGVIFANAMYYNEESSRIWKDAKLLQNHFNELMREQPPDFLPPRRYHTKRMREQEASGVTPTSGSNNNNNNNKQRQQSQGMSEPPEGEEGSDEEEVDYTPNAAGTIQGYPAPPQMPSPAAVPMLPTTAQTAAQYYAGRPTANTTTGVGPSGPFSPATSGPGATAVPPAIPATHPSQPNAIAPTSSTVARPVPMTGSIGALPLANGTKLPAESVVRPLARLPLSRTTASQASPAATTQSQSTGISTRESSRRKVSPAKAAVQSESATDSTKGTNESNKEGATFSSVDRFEIYCPPEVNAIILRNDEIRQHAIVLPSTIDRIRFVIHFTPVSDSTVTSAGGAKHVPEEGTTTADKEEAMTWKLPSFKISTRPDGSALQMPQISFTNEEAIRHEAKEGRQVATLSVERTFSLRQLMTAIEIIVGTGSIGSEVAQKKGGESQVYRLFITKAL